MAVKRYVVSLKGIPERNDGETLERLLPGYVVVIDTDHEAALAERDREITRLNNLLQLHKVDQQVAEEQLRKDYADVLKEAAWAMDLVELTYCQLEHTQELTLEHDLDAYKKAAAFNRRPDVKALKTTHQGQAEGKGA